MHPLPKLRTLARPKNPRVMYPYIPNKADYRITFYAAILVGASELRNL